MGCFVFLFSHWVLSWTFWFPLAKQCGNSHIESIENACYKYFSDKREIRIAKYFLGLNKKKKKNKQKNLYMQNHLDRCSNV